MHTCTIITGVLGCACSLIATIWWALDFNDLKDVPIQVAAMFFSCLAIVDALVAMGCGAFCGCCGECFGSFMFFLAMGCQALTMIILSTCVIATCDLGGAEIVSLVGVVLYFMACIFACALRDPQTPSEESPTSNNNKKNEDEQV